MPSSFQQCLEDITEWCSEARHLERLSSFSELILEITRLGTPLYFQNVLNLMHISEMQEKIRKCIWFFR